MSVLNQSGDDAVECPLCMEPLEVDDLNFFPCTCGYQICRFCWHRIRTDENGLCPACRKAYSENPADFKPLSKEEISRLKAEKRLKDQQRKQRVTENRKHLANVRVVQKNLVFVVGLPMRLADADVLKRHEYFGKFGKIHKVVINQSTSYAGSQGPSASAYVTYQRQEDALRAIEAVNNIIVDARTIKTSLGTTKYCSHFMRNQPCPKPDCMYLHDLGDQEASFTKEEMHQGKHQEYERKLVQSLHASAPTAPNRKPTVSPPMGNNPIRENGIVPISQIKEAWPSLNPGQPNISSTICKDTTTTVPSTTQISVQQQQSNDSAITTTLTTTNITQSNPTTSSSNTNSSLHQNNNNKGEGISGSVSNTRRGKSNSESKAQALRNKHKNNQNKEKHSNTRTTSRSESSSSGNGTQSIDHPQINGEKIVTSYTNDTITSSSSSISSSSSSSSSSSTSSNDSMNNQQTTVMAVAAATTTTTTTNGRCKSEQYHQQNHVNNHRSQHQMNETTKDIEQSIQDIKLNGITHNGDQCNSESENEQQREGSTPASTASSNGSEDSTSNNVTELFVDASEENCDSSDILRSSPTIAINAMPINNVGQNAPPGLHAINGTQTQVNHRSIFQTDNNSFFSSNTFQKISSVMALPSTSQSSNTNSEWTTTCLATIPDSLPSVHSSEDWQAAFGFQPEKCRPNHVPLSPTSTSPSNPFNVENFLDDDDYLDSQYGAQPSKLRSAFDPNVHINNSPASKFMADFQQNSRQHRLILQAQQNHENCEYIKQNGHGLDAKQDTADIKPDDDLGFDPFHETQKALAELMENEIVQQQRLFQQQQQQIHQRNREEHNRSQQHQGFGPTLGPHYSQVAHLAHLQQQAHHLQNLQVLQSHTILSRLPQNMLQQTNVQSPVQPSTMSIGGNIGQRSRLPPPGFPSSTPNHMNSFGLGIPRAAPANNTLAGGQPPQQTSYLPNGNSLITQQGATKCANDTVYGLKDWCEIGAPQAPSQPQQPQQQAAQPFHHQQQLHQKSGWNNFGPVNDWTSLDPAIVSSSRPLPFQTTSTWQFSRFHPTIHNVPHNTQQEQNAPAQHWAMQPPPGFGGPTNPQLNGQQTSTTAQSHTKLISAGPEIENC